jgi:hypothetical protein
MPAATSNVLQVTVAPETQAATPTFSPPAGTYTSAQEVTISTATLGAAIYFTSDGSTPDSPPTGTTELYIGPVTVGSSETLNAIAVAPGYLNSDVGSAAYVIDLAPSLVLNPVVQDTYRQGGFNFNANDLTWNDIGADHYDVWRNLNSAGFAFLATSGDPADYADAGLANSWVLGTYEYFILAKDSGNNTIATSNTEGTTWT